MQTLLHSANLAGCTIMGQPLRIGLPYLHPFPDIGSVDWLLHATAPSSK